MLLKTNANVLQKNSTPYKTLAGHNPEPVRRTAGTLQISPEYTNSVRTLRAAVRANHAAGRGRVVGERADDVSCEIIDTVPFLDQAARRTLRLVVGQLKRACAGPRHRDGNGNGTAD
jgi:hypothetical protein